MSIWSSGFFGFFSRNHQYTNPYFYFTFPIPYPYFVTLIFNCDFSSQVIRLILLYFFYFIVYFTSFFIFIFRLFLMLFYCYPSPFFTFIIVLFFSSPFSYNLLPLFLFQFYFSFLISYFWLLPCFALSFSTHNRL